MRRDDKRDTGRLAAGPFRLKGWGDVAVWVVELDDEIGHTHDAASDRDMVTSTLLLGEGVLLLVNCPHCGKPLEKGGKA